MTTFLSWVDYSATERQRMRQAVALFSQKEARDELGLGSIRDAISNALFPGTSVIQTRLRYALFIPWIYQRLEAERGISTANVAHRARTKEIALIDPLAHADDAHGVIGLRARGELQRLPSSVYWAALTRWRVFERDWSIEDYHSSWDRRRDLLNSQRNADDTGIVLNPTRTWNPHLPPEPASFPHGIGFSLTSDEANFLRERIRESCQGTLLAEAVDALARDRPLLDANYPWDAFRTSLPAQVAGDLALARGFSLLMHGAARLYNLALAARSETFKAKAAEHAGAFTTWYSEAEAEKVASWCLDDLWEFCSGRANVTPSTRKFISEWQRLLTQHGLAVAESEEALTLIEQREWQLKQNRSRFRNQRALEVWGGESGTARLNFRWPTVRILLADLYAGLDQQES